MSFESGRKGGSGYCLDERDFEMHVSTRTQWQQKKKVANSYNSRDGLVTMAASVVVRRHTATVGGGGGNGAQQLWTVAVDSGCGVRCERAH